MFLGLCLGIFLLLYFFLRIYTRHGQTVEVPDFIDMTVEEAHRAAKDRKFVLELDSFNHNDPAMRGLVFIQNPSAGARAKKKRKIHITYARVIPEDETLSYSDLVGRQYQVHKSILERDNFIVKLEKGKSGDREGVVYKATLEDGELLMTDERKNQGKQIEISGMQTIILYYYSGKGSEISIPNLVCQEYDSAIFTLSHNKLLPGVIIPDAPPFDSSKLYYVYRQIPSYDPEERIRIGESIDIYVTEYKPAACSDTGIDLNEILREDDEQPGGGLGRVSDN